jgi:sugar/nucleoside kinase (ribokinase family)
VALHSRGLFDPRVRCYDARPVPELDLITAGDAFEDLVFFGLERLPKPGEEVKTDNFLRTYGGGAVITAVASARLGLRCGVVSGVGAPLVDLLHRENIEVRNVRRDYEPHALTVSLSTKSNRSFVTFNGMNDLLEQRLLHTLPNLHAKHIHFAFPPKSCSLWIPIVKKLQQDGMCVSWDFGWNENLVRDPFFTDLTGTLNVLFVNEEEALMYSGKSSVPVALEFWRKRTRHTVVKCGAGGAMYASATVPLLHVAGKNVDAVDTTGAGDAFNGGFLYALVHSMSIKAALELGNVVGAFSTTKPGGLDGLPHKAELLTL